MDLGWRIGLNELLDVTKELKSLFGIIVVIQPKDRDVCTKGS